MKEQSGDGAVNERHSKLQRVIIKSLPLVSVLADSRLAVSEIQQGKYSNAIIGTALAAGIGVIGSHLILNNGFGINETKQNIRQWGAEKYEKAKQWIPSRRTVVTAAIASMGLFPAGDAAIQTVHGNYYESAQALSAGIALEGIATLRLMRPGTNSPEEYGVPDNHDSTDEESVSHVTFPQVSGLETELRSGESTFLE